MNRIATFTDPEAPSHADRPINSEWVLGRHVRLHNISVSVSEASSTYCRSTTNSIVRQTILNVLEPQAMLHVLCVWHGVARLMFPAF